MITAGRRATPATALGLLAVVCLSALGVAPMLGVQTRVARLVEVMLTGDEVGWVMGGTFDPDPVAAGYFDTVVDGILQRSGWIGDSAAIAPLWTPEEFWPLGTLTFGASVDRGAEVLKAAVLGPNADLTPIDGYPLPAPLAGSGDTGVVFGYSQSATVATAAMPDLYDGLGASAGNLHFVLAGNPNNPMGGILARFAFPGADAHVPLLNIPLGIGATPTDLFATDIYTAEYDGWANFPQDPTNLLADVNALMGIATVHSVYKDLNPAVDLIHLGAAGQTDFFMIPTDQLPILWPVYQLGAPGELLGAALEPGLRLGIDWGYGNPGMAVHPAAEALPAGPWAVNALNQISMIDSGGQFVSGSGLAGFLPMMDPLQMLIGAEEAGVHSLLDPVNQILALAGADTVSPGLDAALHAPVELTASIDQLVMSGWNEMIAALNLTDLLGVDLSWASIFDGLPLISGGPVIAGVGLLFDLLNAVIPVP